MQPINQSAGEEKKTIQASAQAVSGKDGAVAFASAALQRKMTDPPLAEKLTDYNETAETHTKPFTPATPVQREPDGNYADGPPAADGMRWDTYDTEDHNGSNVPTRNIAVMKSPPNGGVPSVNPPGWDWLKSKFGVLKGAWVRFHLINKHLGGPGNDSYNLVPTEETLNLNGAWRNMEESAKTSANVTNRWTYVEVDIVYNDEFPAGIPETIDGKWGYYDGNDWVQVGGNVHLAQGNPSDDQDDINYWYAAQVSQQTLRDIYRLNVNQAQKIKELIDGMWDDQQEFDNAMEAALEQNERLGNANWHNVHGRLYVDEDEDFDGPYGVVFRK